MTATLLEVDDLTIDLDPRGQRSTRLVDGVSLRVEAGEIVGVVGESGCGKSLTMLGVLGLLPPGVEAVTPSEVRLEGTSLTRASEKELQHLRGRVASLIPSDAGAALDPVARIGRQLERAMRAHRVEKSKRRRRILDLLRDVRLPSPEQQARRFPHELSGGMQQRVAIAAALLNRPRLLIADEPTTALDVTVQAQILRMLLDIREETGSGILFVTHDMTAVAEICDRVVVMYAGQVVEAGSAHQVVHQPRHPYTQALLASVPPLGGDRPEQLATIAGTPPMPGRWSEGCRFRDRCPLYVLLDQPARCEQEPPATVRASGSACHFSEEDAA